METLNFSNEVILIYDNIAVVVDDYDNLYFVETDPYSNAYEIGDCVSSSDLSPISELDEITRNIILDELN